MNQSTVTDLKDERRRAVDEYLGKRTWSDVQPRIQKDMRQKAEASLAQMGQEGGPLPGKELLMAVRFPPPTGIWYGPGPPPIPLFNVVHFPVKRHFTGVKYLGDPYIE